MQVLKYEEQVKKLKLENMTLSDRVQTNTVDLLRTEEQLQQFELDLVISQEKHRTCQQEVCTFVSAISDTLWHETCFLERCSW